MFRISSACFASLGLAMLLVASGCGTGAYEERMAATLAEMKTASQAEVSLQDFYGYMPDEDALSGGAVNLRLPMVFQDVYNAGSKDPQTDASIEPKRLYPAGVPLPGYDRTYEAWHTDDAGDQWPYYLYLAAQPAEPGTIDGAASELRSALEAELPGTPDAWQTVELANPAGGDALEWKVLRVEGEMLFDKRGADGNDEYLRVPGAIELYLHHSDGQQVILGWRAPVTLVEPTMIQARVRTAASTLQLGGG